MDSNEKQSPQRFVRYAAMLIMLLTLGVGQMWAGWSFSGSNYFYFVNKGGWGDSNIQMVIGKGTSSGYTSCYNSSTTLSGTKLIVRQGPSPGWTDANFIGFMGNGSNWGSGDWGRDNITNNATHYALYTSGVDASNNQCYAIIPPDDATGKTTSASLVYLGSGYASVNKSQTFKVQVTSDGGNTYSDPATSPAKIAFSSKKLSSFTGTSSSTGNFSAGGSTISMSKDAAYTATTTLSYSSMSSDYTFVCWHDGSSSVGTGTSYTYYPTSVQTITARFTKNFTAGDVLYLLVNSTWKNASGLNHYAAYFYGAEGNTWASCSRVGTSDYYSVTVPAGNWGYVIFVALNNATNNWNYKIYQTDDLMYDASHNGVEITGSNNSQSRITVYTGISVSRTPTAGANAPTITNSQTVVKSGSSVTINAQTEKTGYHWVNWTKTSGTLGNASNKSTTFTPSANSASAVANYALNTQTVTFNKNGGSGTTMSDQVFTYGVAQALTSNSYTAPTGYKFAGWATSSERAAAGTVDYTNGQSVTLSPTTHGTTLPLWAVWTGKQCTLTLDQQTSATGYGSSGTVSVGSKATYGSAMPSLSGTMPTAAQGYAFMGFYSATGGGGTKYYNADGTSANNWAENTESATTLYAYYKQAEITSVTFDDDVVEPGATVTATANLNPTPSGSTIVCWRLLHDNGNEYSPQPTFTPASGTTVSFTAPETSTHYKVEAKLRTGSSCGGGTLLDTETGRFQVAGSHTVTVNYKCGDDVIKAATSVIATPLDWSGDITAPDIFGYTFARWDAADGVTIKNGDSDPVTTTTNATIQIKATYNGKLTAVYTQKSMIYFKNTLGWSNVYVNFYTGSYWNNPKGSGNQSVTKRNLAMTQYGETDIWYYDYGAASITPSLYVSFTSESQDNTEFFWKAGGVNVVYPANYPDAINTDKSSENGFKAATPMFVPLATQDGVTLNQSSGGKADYFNAGYWTKYTPGTGYTLEIYNEAGNVKLKSVEFTSADELMPMKATVDLEGGTTYKFQLKRSGDIYYGNSGTMTYANHGSPTPWDMTNGSFSMCGIITNAAGDYTFNLSYSGNSSTPPHYRLRMAVDYPIADGDYRLIYKDAVHTLWHPSAIVSKGNNRKDTVSFFVRPGSSPVMKIQTASVNPSTGAVTWGSDVAIPTATLTGLTSTDVYNFNLSMDGSGNISLESVDAYTGNFYIRTDAANSKWDNYRSDPDHLMVYSEYSIEHGGYTHYHAHWVNKDDAGRKNVKFTIANDYSPCISDTLTRETAEGTWENIASFITEGGDLLRSANVRFMWDKRDNSISRAYVDGAQGDYSTNFLYMLNVEDGDDKIREENEDPLTEHKVTFKDNGNWMYEADIQAQPDAQIKLLSNWGTSNTITQYFRGASDATETLIGGSGSNWYDIRLIYDFKTNRLIAGLIPSGTIDEQMAIHADVMFIREHQGDIAQLTFAEKGGKMGAITDIETAYGVLRLNKWTLNNKSKADGHAPLSPLLSRYERDLFYISFPFKVAMEDVFGFGTYGQHWIIEYYDGANRAANGYWQESDPNWKFIWDRKGKFFEPGQGYIIALELDELGESSSVWTNTDQVELYFPSYGSMSNITSSTATYEIPAHECTIDRSKESNGHGGTLGDAYDRRVKDSHWNVLGVPTYVNPDAPSFANTDWITTADTLHIGPNFLYEWNPDDNSVTAVSGTEYSYHAMHAYLVQYCGDVTWTSSVSVKPSAPAARRNPAYRGEYEFRIELQQETQAVDQTYVKLSDDERVTTGFEFNYDLSKEFNKKKANIYTLIGTEQVAGNVLPLTEQTTVVPVGVQIKTNGEYTFSMPDGTYGVEVTLIDNETGLRTPLGLTDYTISLEAGTYDDRFVLEIAPIKGTATDIEEAVSDQHSAIRKVMIDGILYIVKDGKVFDARGARIQ